MRFRTVVLASAGSFVLLACSDLTAVPNESAQTSGTSLSASLAATRNLEVILRGVGFGLVKFRQPKDEAAIIYLDTWVRDLAPNTAYLLQRAVDTEVDGGCTGSDWLTLGQGLTPQAITTDERGTGRESLFRDLPLALVGLAFDIQFRVVEQADPAVVVLESACYQYVVSL